jgi:hypothetical protein
MGVPRSIEAESGESLTDDNAADARPPRTS